IPPSERVADVFADRLVLTLPILRTFACVTATEEALHAIDEAGTLRNARCRVREVVQPWPCFAFVDRRAFDLETVVAMIAARVRIASDLGVHVGTSSVAASVDARVTSVEVTLIVIRAADVPRASTDAWRALRALIHTRA